MQFLDLNPALPPDIQSTDTQPNNNAQRNPDLPQSRSSNLNDDFPDLDSDFPPHQDFPGDSAFPLNGRNSLNGKPDAQTQAFDGGARPATTAQPSTVSTTTSTTPTTTTATTTTQTTSTRAITTRVTPSQTTTVQTSPTTTQVQRGGILNIVPLTSTQDGVSPSDAGSIDLQDDNHPLVVELSPTCRLLGEMSLMSFGKNQARYRMLRKSCTEEKKAARKKLQQELALKSKLPSSASAL